MYVNVHTLMKKYFVAKKMLTIIWANHSSEWLAQMMVEGLKYFEN